MRANEVYVDLDGREIALGSLDADERQFVARLRRRARTNPDWNAFDNYWTRAIPAFYKARGLPRKAVRETRIWHIAQDLSGRLGIAAGWIRPDDYLGDLEALIRDHYPQHADFCKATGIPQETLDQFLAGRAELPLQVLEEALDRIGYRLRIAHTPGGAGGGTEADGIG